MNKQQVLTDFRKSRIIRTVLYPLNVAYRKAQLQKYERSADSEYIKSLHNMYEGKRCFVIGNGPSLTPQDLDRIQNEFSFATNRIYHIYDKTAWRPTYYVCTDNNVIAEEMGNIKSIGDYPKFINFHAAKYGRDKNSNIWYICTKGKFHVDPYKPQSSELSEDVSKYVTWIHTVTVTAIELAIYMGFKEIYLLGVDNSYANTVDNKGRIHRDPTVKADYFVGMKGVGSKAGGKEIVSNVDVMNYSYELAKSFAEKKSVKIFNATRGGKLEVFDRAELDKVIIKAERTEEISE